MSFIINAISVFNLFVTEQRLSRDGLGLDMKETTVIATNE